MSVMLQRIALAVPFALLGVGASAQADLQEKYQKKISEDWFTKGGWSVDYAACRERAKKEGKVILAYFTRSYAP